MPGSKLKLIFQETLRGFFFVCEACCQSRFISPLLSNTYLNNFDPKMMSKGLRIVRYADDILIFAKDQQIEGNNRTYATKVLEEEMKLKVNKTKSKNTRVRKGVTFLNFVIYEKCLTINPERIKRFKDKVCFAEVG